MKCKIPIVALVMLMATPAFAQLAFHGSARVIPTAGGRENQVFTFDASGTMTGQYDQIAGAYADSWGYRDGAYDGQSVYFGWGGGVARHDADGSNGTLMFDGTNAPGGTWRALAFDPTGDGGNGSLWSASFASDLVEADMSGNILTTFPNTSTWSLYGLAYDDTDGNLWGHHTGGEVIKIDTTTGTTIPATGWTSGFPGAVSQGGLSGFGELGGNLAAVGQGTPDMAGVYDTAASLGGAGVFAMGAWDWEAQSGTNGHLGVAVIPEPGTLALLGLGIVGLLRRRR